MVSVKFRKVKEIYANSAEVVQPKNTESEGNNGAGGHADAAEHAVELSKGLSVIGKQQNPSEEIHMRQKSGACDVCTSSCSCMLSERHASAAEGTNAHEAAMVDNSPHGSPVKDIKELSHEIAVLSKRSDTSVVSSLKDPYIGASSSKGLRSESSDEQVESSPDGEVRNVNEHNWEDSVKAEFEINGEVAAECSYQKEHLQKLDGSGETIMQPRPFMQPVNRCGGTNKVGDVKTCDICGDVGWDDCLATCSRCSNGAEHIYCMRLKLDKVPEGNWLCEDCTLADENEKKKQDKSSKNSVEGSSSYQLRKNSGTSDSVKRIMDISKTLPIKKRRDLEKVGELSILPKPCFKAAEDCSLASRNLDERKTDSTSQGSLCKSKSFNNIKSGEESNQQWGGAEKQRVDKETAIEGTAHSEPSIKNSMSGDGKVVDSEVNKHSSEFPQAANSIITKLGKILSLAADKNWHRNLVRPPVIQNGASTSLRSGKPPVQGETVFAVPPKSKHHDIMDVQGDGKSSDPSKSNSETVFPAPPRSKHHDIMDVQGDGKSSDPSKSNSETVFPVPRRSKHHDIMAVQGDGKSSQSSKSNSPMKNVENMTTALVTKPNNLIVPSSSGVPPRAESMPGTTSAVNPSCFPISPQFNCIWQGGFEVLGRGAIPKPCDGIQAYLSTCSAPKVREVTQRLPQKILVVQVPRMPIRPSQVEQSQAIKYNIALYFFARDVESYETNYKKLLDQMIKCDLALKGNVDGVELLIFTSNLLPEKWQRWNGLLFLWGVFSATKSRNSQDLPSPLSISSVSCINADPSGSLPSPQSSGMLSTSSTLYNSTPKAPDSCISSEKPCLPSADLGKNSENEISSPQSKLSGLQNADEQLSAVGSLSKSVQPSGELHPSDILSRESKGGKRRAEIEIDLLASRETNDKRWKSYLEMFQVTNSSRFSSEFKGLDSGSGKDPRLGRALTIGPMSPPPQAVSMKDKNMLLEHEIPNLELSLGAGKKKVAQEISSPSHGLVCNNNGKCSIDRTSNGNDECLTSLTLSLALLVSDEQNKGKCSISRTSSESDECLTSLTLSLALPASNEQNKGWNNNE